MKNGVVDKKRNWNIGKEIYSYIKRMCQGTFFRM